jgi:O-methyltransferase
VSTDAHEWDLDELLDVLTGFDVQDACITGNPFGWPAEFDPATRDEGLDWPERALTMVGRQRLRNLRTLIERVIADDVAGDVLEAGVWRGGASIFARAVLATHGVTDRKVIVADSFEGLPPPSPDYPADHPSRLHTYPQLAVSLEEVQANFDRFGLLDGQVVFLKGWFRDTMPLVQSSALAVMRLDGDLYESTIDPLVHLYDRLSVGGWVILDDYSVSPPCQLAISDFFSPRGGVPRLEPIDRVGVCFQKVAR